MALKLNLLKYLRTSRYASDEPGPSVPEGMRIYAIGDIHGRSDLLKQLQRRIRQDARATGDGLEKIIVYLGDYIDRGLDSKGVIDLLLDAPLEGLRPVYLKGNHEDALLRFLEDRSIGPEWFSFGGDATAMSYGVRLPKGLASADRFEHVWRELRGLIPKRHVKFLSRLQLMYQAGDYIFVHAGIRPEIPIEQQDPHDLMWIRDEFLDWQGESDKVVVHGHSVTGRPSSKNNRIGIDTGAFATNVLTCVVLERDTRRFLATDGASRR